MSKKWYTTYSDILKLYGALGPHQSLIDTIVQESTEPLVFCAEYDKTDKGLVVKVYVYTFKPVPLSIRYACSGYVNVGNEWMNKHRLWFRKCAEGFEAFIDYLEDYRDHFTVEVNKPKMTFTLTIPT